LISDAAQLKQGDQITSRLAHGTVISRVEDMTNENTATSEG